MGDRFKFTRLLLLAILQAIGFILIVVATPLDLLHTWGTDVCYGLFGEKKSCGVYGVSITNTSWGCTRRKVTMIIAASFGIASILFSLIATIMAFLQYFRVFLLRWGLFIITLMTNITLLVTWACVADVFHRRMCGGSTGLGAVYFYGPAFGLIVFTWALELIIFILAALITF
ncbi:amastin-like surface protein-like protein [Trypanosoma theileri]|uniref:Amastin-like surface protein-like protein n=1 Tax=Trypanosoma theileri TaxID=67003 RepID=A0A1X0NVN5_9TRYP|nr:amastin-like surface protein-like protein [Trypanosoma theileri]ORC88732.1 amastin-like surface protein-like protein [Trypanosoma theileri]